MKEETKTLLAKVLEMDKHREEIYTEEQYSVNKRILSGSDAVPFFNGRVIPEVQGVTWHKVYGHEDEYPVRGSVIVTELGEDPLLQIPELGDIHSIHGVVNIPNIDIVVAYINEFGFSAHRVFSGVKFIAEGSSFTTDDLITERVIHFEAQDVTPMIPISMEEFRDRMAEQYPAFRTTWLSWDGEE